MKMLTVALMMASSLPVMAQAAPKHTGKWWLEHSDVYREAYVNGYQSGWHRGIGHDTPLKPFGARTVTDGLDKFYADFKNRIIPLDDAIGYVAEELNGASPEELKAKVLKLRAAAAKNGEAE